MPLTAGSRLGPYEIVSPLGAGGMGEVYRARDTRLGRDVAVKVLPQHLADTPEARARFEREAKAISSLNHPNICTLHDVGRHEDTDFLVMELVEGETLTERIARGPLPPEEAMRLGVQVADALDKAHRQGLVHRDLKPGNIMLTRSGAKLLDFGLARATGLAPTVTDLSSSPTMSPSLTAEGMIVGTFMYMSPEQLEGKEADVRSDLWALGVVLYESVTGRKAFSGKSQASLIGAIMHTQPPALSGISELAPPGLERLVNACLAKDPDERIQTAHDVKLQLQWILEGGSQAGVPAPVAAKRRGRERALVLATASSVMAMLVMGGWLALKPRHAPQMMRFEIAPPTTVQFLDAPRISPDGQFLAYNATDSLGVSRIWLRPMESLEAQQLQGTEGAKRPFWSPDSRFLGFIAGGKLKKVAVNGGPPVVLCDAPTGADGSWGRKDVILFDGAQADPILRVSAAGGVAAPVAWVDSARTVVQVGWPEILPDGRHFLFLAMGARSTLCVGDIDSKKVVEVGPCESQMKFVPPDMLLFSRGGTLVTQHFDTRSYRLRGEPVPVAEKVSADAIGTSEFGASDNGILVYSTKRAQGGRLVQLDRTGHLLKTLAAPTTLLHIALSPDGRHIAMRARDNMARGRDIWLTEIARDISTRFTFEPTNENYPVWAPDGKSILYNSDAPGAAGLHLKQLSGTGEDVVILPWTHGEAVPQCWSRDGQEVFFTVAADKTQDDIWVLRMTGDRKATPFLNSAASEGMAALSPDGRYLAYASNESGHDEVYVQSYPDRKEKWQASTKGGTEPQWSADGKQLYYMAADQQLTVIPIRTTPAFDLGLPQALFHLQELNPDVPRPHYCVSQDGSSFYATVPDENRLLPSTYVVVNWQKALK